MRRRIGHIEIETIAAERSKFTASLVLVHGLWCTSSAWYRLMGYLAHRGWDCHALNLRGRNAAAKAQPQPSNDFGLSDHIQDLNAVVAACDAPPVLVGHDLGGLLALAPSIAPIRAVVALAPLLPAAARTTPIPGITDLRGRLTMRILNRLPPPSGRAGHRFFGSVPPQPLVSEPTSIGRQLADTSLAFPLGSSVPTLIVAGDADEVTPIANLSKLTQDIGGELQRVGGGGHAVPWDVGWQERVTDIHRWLIRTLGDSLLAMLDEEEEN